MADTPTSSDSAESKYLGFFYPEIKDLSKHFLTIVSGVLAFTVTFSDRIVGFSMAPHGHRGLLIVAWVLFLIAIVLTGLAIVTNYIGATEALRGHERRLSSFRQMPFLTLDAAGLSFVAGLLLLAWCAAHLRKDDASYAPQAQADEFIDVVRTEWCGDGFAMRLLEDFGYRDPKNHTWWARKNDVIDGASIPRLFWGLIGGPYEGKYRNASVVHDIACVRRDRPWKTTHRMFYLSCLRGGVGQVKAKIMFAAVYHFGPRWRDGSQPEEPIKCGERLRNHNLGASAIEPNTYFTSEDDYYRLKQFIETNPNVSLQKIEELTSRDLEGLIREPRRPRHSLNVEMPDDEI